MAHAPLNASVHCPLAVEMSRYICMEIALHCIAGVEQGSLLDTHTLQTTHVLLMYTAATYIDSHL